MASIIVDLSSNNGHPIDYQAAKDSGVIAAIVKATDGTSYVNPYYGADSAGFEAVGVPVIAYHFAEFGDAVAEAAHFVAVAGDRARVLDSETNSNVEWQNEFLSALHLPSNEEMDYGSASTLPRGGIRALLWPASYGRDYGFGDAWQFTDAQVVPGIPGLVDASIWRGTQADFDSLFNIAPPALDGPTNYPGDKVKAIPVNVQISQGHGWIPSPVPAATVVTVSVDDINPEVSGIYDDVIPTYRGAATQAGPHSPNGALCFTGPQDGIFGAVVWAAE
jgi:lysozyme